MATTTFSVSLFGDGPPGGTPVVPPSAPAAAVAGGGAYTTPHASPSRGGAQRAGDQHYGRGAGGPAAPSSGAYSYAFPSPAHSVLSSASTSTNLPDSPADLRHHLGRAAVAAAAGSSGIAAMGARGPSGAPAGASGSGGSSSGGGGGGGTGPYHLMGVGHATSAAARGVAAAGIAGGSSSSGGAAPTTIAVSLGPVSIGGSTLLPQRTGVLSVPPHAQPSIAAATAAHGGSASGMSSASSVMGGASVATGTGMYARHGSAVSVSGSTAAGATSGAAGSAGSLRSFHHHASSGGGGGAAAAAGAASGSHHHHPPPLQFSRVRVAVRCRPPFPEEGATPAIVVLPPGAPLQPASLASLQQLDPAGAPPASGGSGGQPASRAVHVEVAPGKRREFAYDVCFGPGASNHDVYNVIGGPVVESVLKGVNGTILAYGQTGSGKTHSLGILTRVTGESGLIPRALSHIFGAISLASGGPAASAAGGVQYAVSMSFCQLYLDTVMDLLAPTPGNAAPGRNLLDGGLPGPSGGSGTATPGGPHHHGASFSGGLNSSFNDAASQHSFGSGVASSAGGGGGGGGTGRSSSAPRGDRYTASSGPAGGPGAAASGGGIGLAVREDPARGFYVEGLSEYAVRSWSEAVALLNWGLENRVLGATRMNATSSRSHTLLTVRIETRTPVALPPAAASDGAGSGFGYVTRRSQLMLCDLAGSERVRRTSSRGARLEEARAINASLHTLGQVIAALSSLSTQQQHAHMMAGAGGGGGGAPVRMHVPWRDSKLTRLLHGNLGGNSNTFLLATVGPGFKNVSESLSTLLFASRCMRVAAAPVSSSSLLGGYSNTDYADVAARLQERLSRIESTHAVEMAALSARYEAALRDVSDQLEAAAAERASALAQAANALAVAQHSAGSASSSSFFRSYNAGEEATGPSHRSASGFIAGSDALALDTPLRVLFQAEAEADSGGSDQLGLLFALHTHGGRAATSAASLRLSFLTMLRLYYARCTRDYDAATGALLAALYRAGKHARSWRRAIDRAAAEEANAAAARASMMEHDPYVHLLQAKAAAAAAPTPAQAAAVTAAARKRFASGQSLSTTPHPETFGPHLGHAYRSAAAALATVHMTHSSNAFPSPSLGSEGAADDDDDREVEGDAAGEGPTLNAAFQRRDEDAALAVAGVSASGAAGRPHGVAAPVASAPGVVSSIAAGVPRVASSAGFAAGVDAAGTAAGLPAHLGSTAALAALSASAAGGATPGTGAAAMPSSAAAGATSGGGVHGIGASGMATTLLSPPIVPLGAVLAPLALAIVTGSIHSKEGRAAAAAASADGDGSAALPPTLTASQVLASLSAAMLGLAPDHAGSGSAAGGPLSRGSDDRDDAFVVGSPRDSDDGGDTDRPSRATTEAPNALLPVIIHPALSPSTTALPTVSAVLAYCSALGAATAAHVCRLNALAAVKDARYDDAKRHLAAAEASVRVRDEDAANQRYVLRYLVESTSQLRAEVTRLSGSGSAAASPGTAGGAGGFAVGPASGRVASTSAVRPLAAGPGAALLAAAVGSEVGGVEDRHAARDAAAEQYLFAEADAEIQRARTSGDAGAGVVVATAAADHDVSTRIKQGAAGSTVSSDAFSALRARRQGSGGSAPTSATSAPVSTAATAPPASAAQQSAPPAAAPPQPLPGRPPRPQQPPAATLPTAPAANGDAVAIASASAAAASSRGRQRARTGRHGADDEDDGTDHDEGEAYDRFDYHDEVGDGKKRRRRRDSSGGRSPSPAAAGLGAPAAAAAGRAMSAVVANPLAAPASVVVPPVAAVGAGGVVGPVADDVDDAGDQQAADDGIYNDDDGEGYGDEDGDFDGDDEDEEDDDEVEYIVSHRVVPGDAASSGAAGGSGQRVLYRVHWRGTAPTDDEWFDRDDLAQDFPRAVAEYESRLRAGDKTGGTFPWMAAARSA